MNNRTDDRKSGIAFIAGSLGSIITMAIHPVGSVSLTAAQVEHLAWISAVAHALGMLSIVLLVLGAFGLTRRLNAPDRFAVSGMVFFAFASVAILIATAVSGFIVPNIMQHMTRDVATAADQWQIAIVSIFQFNQAFARIYSVAASIAIGLWSISVLRNGGFGRGFAIYGCIAAALLIVVISVGHLKLDVHGMAVVVFVHIIWFIGVGKNMYSNDFRYV